MFDACGKCFDIAHLFARAVANNNVVYVHASRPSAICCAPVPPAGRMRSKRPVIAHPGKHPVLIGQRLAAACAAAGLGKRRIVGGGGDRPSVVTLSLRPAASAHERPGGRSRCVGPVCAWKPSPCRRIAPTALRRALRELRGALVAFSGCLAALMAQSAGMAICSGRYSRVLGSPLKWTRTYRLKTCSSFAGPSGVITT